MIKTFFGLSRSPFVIDENAPLLEHQQRHLDVIKAHCHQGGFCLILGESGTGKSVLKDAIVRHDPGQLAPLVINRCPRAWPDLLRLLCEGLQLETTGGERECQTRLISEARRLNAMGVAVVPIIEDAHLLPVDLIGELCRLLDQFPKNHCLILIGRPDLGAIIRHSKHPNLKSRVTHIADLDIGTDTLTNYIRNQLELASLPPHTFTDDALALILRSSKGTLRDVNNLCLGSLIEAVNDGTRTVGVKQVDAVLMQPHRRGYR